MVEYNMFYTYILKSLKTKGYYIGSTGNLEDRLKRHMQGRSKYTKLILPVELVYFETFESRSDAFKREKEIKSYKSKLYIEKLINMVQ